MPPASGRLQGARRRSGAPATRGGGVHPRKQFAHGARCKLVPLDSHTVLRPAGDVGNDTFRLAPRLSRAAHLDLETDPARDGSGGSHERAADTDILDLAHDGLADVNEDPDRDFQGNASTPTVLHDDITSLMLRLAPNAMLRHSIAGGHLGLNTQY
jgi:hypothetical protein